MPGALEQADVLLGIIAAQTEIKEKHEAALAAEIDTVRAKYTTLTSRCAANIADAEKELKKLAKKHKRLLFAMPGETGEARRNLPSGHALIYGAVKRVRRIKGMLRRLKLSGLTRAVKVAESVDWEAVEALDDDILVQLGTEREIKESFSYEVKR